MQLREAMCVICQKIALNVIQKAQTQSRGPVYKVKLAEMQQTAATATTSGQSETRSIMQTLKAFTHQMCKVYGLFLM